MTLHVVILPKTGMYEDDVTLIEWLIEEGGRVLAGEPLFVMESEKVEMEIEANEDGWLHQEASPGFEAAIGSRIGVVADTAAEQAQITG